MVFLEYDLSQYTKLHTLQVSTKIHFELLDRLSAILFQSSPSVKILKFIGVHVSNLALLNIATRSLQKVTISYYDGGILGDNEVGNSEQLQWSTITTLCNRNPNISRLQLRLESRRVPFTYEDIDNISQACSELKKISIFNTNREYRKVKEEREITDVPWQYTRRSNIRCNDIIKRVSGIINGALL